MERETRAYFTTRPDGRLDPAGLVKGWAIEKASTLLRELGSAHHAINGGGDMQLAGDAAPGRPWRIGISDPTDRSRVVATVHGRDCAVATSGSAERGVHIVNPATGLPASGLASATVVGPSLTTADAYATAAFAMGRAAWGWLETLPGYEALLIDDAGEPHRTPGWRDAQGAVTLPLEPVVRSAT